MPEAGRRIRPGSGGPGDRVHGALQLRAAVGVRVGLLHGGVPRSGHGLLHEAGRLDRGGIVAVLDLHGDDRGLRQPTDTRGKTRGQGLHHILHSGRDRRINNYGSSL